MTKLQATEALREGKKISHRHYSDDEFIHMIDGIIYDENGYVMGGEKDEFWSKMQKWEAEWFIKN